MSTYSSFGWGWRFAYSFYILMHILGDTTLFTYKYFFLHFSHFLHLPSCTVSCGMLITWYNIVIQSLRVLDVTVLLCFTVFYATLCYILLFLGIFHIFASGIMSCEWQHVDDIPAYVSREWLNHCEYCLLQIYCVLCYIMLFFVISYIPYITQLVIWVITCS